MLHNQKVDLTIWQQSLHRDRFSDLLHKRVRSVHVSQLRPIYTCSGQTCLSLSLSHTHTHTHTLCLFLSPCLSLSLALDSHSLLGIRPQPQCCDGRWQLAQKGWHVIGKCAAPKMSFLIKRFWSVVNCGMLGKMRDSMWSEIQGHDTKGSKEKYCILSALYAFHFILKTWKETGLVNRMLSGRTLRRKYKTMNNWQNTGKKMVFFFFF